MLQKLNKKTRQGFTLVEIMIVVAIIALLAAIAVPNFLRSRKRSQALAILEEVKLVEGAKQQWAVEGNKKGDDTPDFDTDLKRFLKAGSRLADSGGTDTLNNEFTLGNVDTPVKVSADTIGEFTVDNGVWGSEDEETKFWGEHKP